MLVRIANREDLDQTDSSESVVCAVCLGPSVQNFSTFTSNFTPKSVRPLWTPMDQNIKGLCCNFKKKILVISMAYCQAMMPVTWDIHEQV